MFENKKVINSVSEILSILNMQKCKNVVYNVTRAFENVNFYPKVLEIVF